LHIESFQRHEPPCAALLLRVARPHFTLAEAAVVPVDMAGDLHLALQSAAVRERLL